MGGWGEAWGGGPWRAGKGGDGGGAPESSVGATKGALVPCLGSLNLTTGLIWLVTRGGDGGRRGEVAHGGRARGEMGGAPESSVGATKGALVPAFQLLKNLTSGLIWLVTTGGMGGGVGRWPMEGGQGGRWGGGAPESSVGATKGALVPLFGLP